MNLCRTCGEDFGSISAFDAHRVGKYEYTWSPDREDGRRCLGVDELEDKGFRLNRRGAWSTSKLAGTRSERLTVGPGRHAKARAG
jgi:hypothetical protein